MEDFFLSAMLNPVILSECTALSLEVYEVDSEPVINYAPCG